MVSWDFGHNGLLKGEVGGLVLCAFSVVASTLGS